MYCHPVSGLRKCHHDVVIGKKSHRVARHTYHFSLIRSKVTARWYTMCTIQPDLGTIAALCGTLHGHGAWFLQDYGSKCYALCINESWFSAKVWPVNIRYMSIVMFRPAFRMFSG